MPGTDQTLAKHSQAAAWSVALIVGLAWAAWTSRWQPSLAFELEKMEFSLAPGNAADPPEVICSAEVRVINSGSAVFMPRAFAAWSPVSTEPHDTYRVLSSPLLNVNDTWHGPASVDQVKVQFDVQVMNPTPVRDRITDWLCQKFPITFRFPTKSRWLDVILYGKETRTFSSPWYEAKVPPITELQPSSTQ